MKQWAIAYGPALLWAAAVTAVGGWSDLPGPSVDLPIDKMAHFSMYGVLGALAARGWQRMGRRPGWWWLILAVWLLGAWDEWRQRGISGRSSEPADWAADAAGVVIGFVIGGVALEKAREREGDES